MDVALVDDDVVRIAAVDEHAIVAFGVVGADEADLAVLLVLGFALLADAAGVDHDAYAGEVADGEARDLGADGGDAADDLVAGHHGEDGWTPVLIDLVDVGVADAGVEDLDDDIVRAGVAAIEAEGGQRGGFSEGGVAFGLHGSP